MTDLEVALLIVACAWLALLSVVSLLLVRQVGLLTVRLDRERSASSPVNDGLQIGEALPERVAKILDLKGGSAGYLLVLGAICSPCRELANDLRGHQLAVPVTALISGRAEAGEALGELLPAGVGVVQDTPAADLAGDLRIETTPFAFEVTDGRITGKAVVRGATHFMSFIDGGKSTNNGTPLALQEVNGGGTNP